MKLLKPRFLLLYALIPWLFLSAHTTERQLRAGIALALLGLAIRLWANAYVGRVKVNATQGREGEAKIGRLVTSGPYAYVRHPLYLGSFLIGAGFCIIAGNVWLAGVGLVAFLTIYRRKMADEEALMRAELGAPYLLYQGAVPRWLPTGRRYAVRNNAWDWRGILASKEWKTVLWVLALFGVFYLREEIFQETGFFGPEERWKHIGLIVVTLGLMLSDGLIELARRRRKLLMQKGNVTPSISGAG